MSTAEAFQPQRDYSLVIKTCSVQLEGSVFLSLPDISKNSIL